MGSDESHFNVSLAVREKFARQRPQTTTFEEKGELKRILTEVLLLTSLKPYRWAKPAHNIVSIALISTRTFDRFYERRWQCEIYKRYFCRQMRGDKNADFGGRVPESEAWSVYWQRTGKKWSWMSLEAKKQRQNVWHLVKHNMLTCSWLQRGNLWVLCSLQKGPLLLHPLC